MWMLTVIVKMPRLGLNPHSIPRLLQEQLCPQLLSSKGSPPKPNLKRRPTRRFQHQGRLQVFHPPRLRTHNNRVSHLVPIPPLLIIPCKPAIPTTNSATAMVHKLRPRSQHQLGKSHTSLLASSCSSHNMMAIRPQQMHRARISLTSQTNPCPAATRVPATTCPRTTRPTVSATLIKITTTGTTDNSRNRHRRPVLPNSELGAHLVHRQGSRDRSTLPPMVNKDHKHDTAKQVKTKPVGIPPRIFPNRASHKPVNHIQCCNSNKATGKAALNTVHILMAAMAHMAITIPRTT